MWNTTSYPQEWLESQCHTVRACEDVDEWEPSYIANGSVKWLSHVRKQSNSSLNIRLSYDSAILFLGIYPIEMRTYVHTKTYA